MEKIVFRVLIITSACSLSQKHIFNESPKTWPAAKAYCKEYHTALSPINSKLEEEAFIRAVGDQNSGWIGLYFDPAQPAHWMWAGAGPVTYENWKDEELFPSVSHMTTNAYWTHNGWLPYTGSDSYSFFCLSLNVVEERKSWEEALDHCREKYTNLTSLLSETEIHLAQTEMQHYDITEPVWIGLRYLGDRWLWVNGDPLVYMAWSDGKGQECPMWKRCGALTEEGRWEDRDCAEKLKSICI